jgi:hypothetical protein
VAVRASDDSGCRAQFCVSQREDVVSLQRPKGGRLEVVGQATLAELLSSASRSSTVVENPWDATVEVAAGVGAVLHHDDPFCRGVLRVDAIK